MYVCMPLLVYVSYDIFEQKWNIQKALLLRILYMSTLSFNEYIYVHNAYTGTYTCAYKYMDIRIERTLVRSRWSMHTHTHTHTHIHDRTEIYLSCDFTHSNIICDSTRTYIHTPHTHTQHNMRLVHRQSQHTYVCTYVHAYIHDLNRTYMVMPSHLRATHMPKIKVKQKMYTWHNANPTSTMIFAGKSWTSLDWCISREKYEFGGKYLTFTRDCMHAL
jgi:hypothetical protein